MFCVIIERRMYGFGLKREPAEVELLFVISSFTFSTFGHFLFATQKLCLPQVSQVLRCTRGVAFNVFARDCPVTLIFKEIFLSSSIWLLRFERYIWVEVVKWELLTDTNKRTKKTSMWKISYVLIDINIQLVYIFSDKTCKDLMNSCL